MTLIELIGFVIVMLAFLFLIVKRAWDERQRRKYPERYEEEERQKEEALREFLRTLDIEVEDEQEKEAIAHQEMLSPPPPMPQIEPIEIVDKKKNPRYAIEKRTSYVQRLIQKNRKNFKDIIILSEIIGPPRSHL